MLHFDPKVILFLQVVVVVGLPLVIWGPLRLGRLFPLPIVQILAGMALGPSAFGLVAPEAFKFLFRGDVLAGIDTLSSMALVLFVFLAGCELDRQILRAAAGKVLSVGLAGVMVPWLAGTAAAWLMLTSLNGPDILGASVSPWLFSVAFGLCMAVTALPVLVVILRELGFNEKPIGTVALAVGGVDDALLWSSLTILLPFAAGTTGTALQSFLVAAAGAVTTILLLSLVIAPALQRIIERDAPERMLVSSAIIVLFAFAALNEATQLHSAIGAFLTGLLLPDKVRHLCQDRFDAPVTLLLLPFLFLSTGLHTDFNFSNGALWSVAALAMIGGIGAKFLGIAIPTRLTGESWAFSITLGTLMQCKGLMEIVVVTILYQKGVFGQATFSALIMIALISTATTVPLARLCARQWGNAATASAWSAALDMGAAPASTGPSPRLVFIEGGGIVPITKADAVIGRHSQDDIRIPDVRVSRHHARLTSDKGMYEIHNLTALRSEPNPLLVNGQQRERAELFDGDEISIGGVKLRFKVAA
ncbi:cation:proton antiporter domain-containing protein [Bradyrhizobium sp. HKCCYLS20291]|uniref:cation:proton antiporter domain-containing protein n=1 Tax=Bradyrhizobium sp. HKCCYLS20291 TaxID=3420766 RepID=UPI003EBE54DF